MRESTDDDPTEPNEDDRIAESEFSFTFTKLASRPLSGSLNLDVGGTSEPDSLVTLDLEAGQGSNTANSSSPV